MLFVLFFLDGCTFLADELAASAKAFASSSVKFLRTFLCLFLVINPLTLYYSFEAQGTIGSLSLPLVERIRI